MALALVALQGPATIAQTDSPGPATMTSAAAGTQTPPPLSPRPISFHNTHTGEDLTLLMPADGPLDFEARAQLDHLLRDHRSGEVGRIDPALFGHLIEVAQRAGVPARFEVISAFRSASSNEYLRQTGGGGVSRNSLHMQGKAIDVRLHGVTTARLRELAVAMGRGGVGYYPQSDFVHLDTGRVRTWTGK